VRKVNKLVVFDEGISQEDAALPGTPEARSAVPEMASTPALADITGAVRNVDTVTPAKVAKGSWGPARLSDAQLDSEPVRVAAPKEMQAPRDTADDRVSSPSKRASLFQRTVSPVKGRAAVQVDDALYLKKIS